MESRRTPFHNPYKPLQPAEGMNFAGREDIIRTFRQRIAADARTGVPANRHMLLVGVGGIGKTSLLLRLEHEFRHTYPRLRKRAIYLNLTDYSADAAGLIADLRAALPDPSHVRSGTLTFFGLGPTASGRDLVAKLKDDFVQSVALTFPIPSWQFTPGVFLKPLPPHEGIVKQLARLLAELSVLTSEDGRPTLVLIDDVGLATDIPGGPQLVHGLDRLMEATVRAKNRNLLLVLADRPERKGQLEYHFRTQLFHPAYVQTLNVYPLTQQEARSAVLNPAEEAGVHLGDRLASDLVESAGVHPYFLQIACSHVWDHLAAENKLGDQPVQLDTDTVAMIVTRGQAKLFEDFNSDEQYLLKVLARSGRPLDAMEIKRMVELEDKDDLIDVDSTLESLLKHKHRPITASRQRDDYGFTHALFRDYIREHKLTADEREVAALQALLDGVMQAVDSGLTTAEQAPLGGDALGRAWKHRDALRISDRAYDLLAVADLVASGPPWTWATTSTAATRLVQLLGSIEPDWRRKAASALRLIGQPALGPLTAALHHEYWRVRSGAASILGDIGDVRAVDALVHALSDDQWRVRHSALRALGKVGGARALGAFIEALRDEDPSIRLTAVEALGRVAGARAAHALIEALRDEDASIRLAAVEALGGVHGARAADGLIEALRHEDLSVRLTAVQVLGEVPGARALDGLTEALRDEDASVRQSAVEMLGRVGGGRAVDALTEALRDGEPSVRLTAVQALGTVGGPHAVEGLTEALLDEDASVRQSAVGMLGRVGGPRAVGALIEALLDGGDVTRLAVAQDLPQIAHEQAVVPLIQVLQDAPLEVRKAAVQALANIADERVVMPLIHALRDEDQFVGEAAALALVRMGDQRAVGPLIEALRHGGDATRLAVAQGLPQIAHQQAVVPLIEVLQDAPLEVRKAAVEALANIADERAVMPLIHVLRDQLEDLGVRRVAVNTLGLIPGLISDSRAVDALIHTCLDEHEDVDIRKAAARPLSLVADERTVQALTSLLDDGVLEMRVAAMEGLSQIGEPAVEALVAALKNDEWWVRRIVAETLGRIGDRKAEEPLIAALHDENRWVRRESALALGQLGGARSLAHLEKLAMADPRSAPAAKEAIRRITAAQREA